MCFLTEMIIKPVEIGRNWLKTASLRQIAIVGGGAAVPESQNWLEKVSNTDFEFFGVLLDIWSVF